jgi:hypothetical protein
MRSICARLALAVVALLALPQPAGASVLDIPSLVPQQFRAAVRARLHVSSPHRGFESRLKLESRDGFEIAVFGVGNVVALEVTRPARHPAPLERLFNVDRAATAYVTRGTVTRRRIKASFGRLGEVDVRFHPSGRVDRSRPRRHCTGPNHFTSRLGVFAGVVRFHGEKHYVATDARRVKGLVRIPLRLACAPPFLFGSRGAATRARPVREHRRLEFTTLSAGDRDVTAGTELLAFRLGRATLFLALDETNTGRMAEIRYGFATAPSKRFATNDALTGATVRPPPPFHGTGIYSAGPDGTATWKGGLTVTLPGTPHLQLAGDAFSVELEAGF